MKKIAHFEQGAGLRSGFRFTTIESFDRLMSVSLRGTFFLAQAFARGMVAGPADSNTFRSIITKESMELATPEWVHHRLLEPIGYIPPAEAEANYYRQLASHATTVAL